jgi:glycosyltransferase involved in cell wall biosynthesis
MGYVFIGDSLRARLLRPFVRQLMRLAVGGEKARLVLQNPDDVHLFVRHGLASCETIRVIAGSGVDCARFLPPKAGRADGVPLRVLLAARMLWDKGVQEFVDAGRLLREQGRAVNFILAGTPDPGNPAAIPEETLAGWHRSGDVEWLGHVDDMPALLASADVVALPSYREGLPKSLIEAGACARPLVATDVPGCREVITDGLDGLLVPVRQSAAVARLQDDSDMTRRLGEAARRKALSEFDECIVIEKTLAVYREVMSEASGKESREPLHQEPAADLRCCNQNQE